MPTQQSFQDAVIERGLPALERAAVHELAFHLAEGQLDDGVLHPEDLAQAVLVRELPRLDPAKGVDAAILSLRGKVVTAVTAMVERLQADGPQIVSIDAALPEGDRRSTSPPLAPEYRGLGRNGLGHVLADVLSAPLGESGQGLDPEQLVAELEVRRQLVEALFTLPPGPRRLVEQRVLDGFSAQTIAAHEYLRPNEVEAMVDQAISILALLVGEDQDDDERRESARVRALYTALGARLGGERTARASELVRMSSATR